MAEPLHGRALIEERFGKLGTGKQEVVIDGAEYDVPTLLARMDLALDDLRVFDIVELNQNHFCLRYYDGQDQRVVAHEFDASFRFLNETRGHVAEWIGEDAYFDSMKSAAFPCVLIPGKDF